MSLNKKGYFQGGGGVNEPTPGEKKYKSDAALVVQPRFKEPFYRNYDLYTIPGMEDIGPGTGYHGLQGYNSVSEFLEARRERLKPRYVADDSWQLDSGKRTKENPGIKARAAIFERIIKTARMPGMGLFHSLHRKFKDDDHAHEKCLNCGNEISCKCMTNKVKLIDFCSSCKKEAGPNYDLGKGLYQEMSDGKVNSVEEFREEGNHGPSALMNVKKKDVNHIDFPIDDEINHDSMIYPIEDEYEIRREKGDRYQFPSDGSSLDPEDLNISMTSPQIAGEHSNLPEPDFAGRSDEALNFGRDYDDEPGPGRQTADEVLQNIFNKYLTPNESGLFGLPDGVDPEGHDADQTEQVEQPFTGKSDIGTDMYDDKWNI